jgi:hypothetical protein
MKNTQTNHNLKAAGQFTDKREWVPPVLRSLDFAETRGTSGSEENDGPAPRTAIPKPS